MRKTAEQLKHDLVIAAQEATNVIASAAEKATNTIASAALDATKLLADNAHEANKVAFEKNCGDHDLLIELKTKMDGLKEDIKGLKEGTSVKIEDHEKRLGRLEKTNAFLRTMLTVGTSLLVAIWGILIYHLFQK